MKGNKKSFYRYIGDKRKIRETMGSLQKKQETWLPRTWRRLRYSATVLPQSSPTSAPATLPKKQKAKAGTGRMKNCQLWEKIGFKTI